MKFIIDPFAKDFSHLLAFDRYKKSKPEKKNLTKKLK